MAMGWRTKNESDDQKDSKVRNYTVDEAHH